MTTCPVGYKGITKIEGKDVFCDNGWILVAAYKHNDGENNKLDFGTIPLDPINGYSHVKLSDISKSFDENSIEAVRFYCHTSNHNRVLNFYSKKESIRKLVKNGNMMDNNWEDYTTEFTKMPNHTAFLPEVANYGLGGLGRTMVSHPFARSGENAWSVRYENAFWACDDADQGQSHDTLHQMWVWFKAPYTPTSLP